MASASSSVSSTLKRAALLIGDVVVLYVSLAITLFIRSRGVPFETLIDQHLVPFSTLFVLWVAVFYVAGLYDLRRLRNNIMFVKTLALAIFVNIAIGIGFFYLIPAFGITPKTNLIIFSILFIIPAALWRRLFNRMLGGTVGRMPVLLVGEGETVREIHELMKTEPQYGYAIAAWMREEYEADPGRIETYAADQSIELIVVPRQFKHNTELARSLYSLLSRGVAVRDALNIYEELSGKVPLRDVDEAWLLEHLTQGKRFYDELRSGLEYVIAAVLQVVFLPLELVIALLVKLTSPGPVIYRQVRAGQDAQPFILYKFRTMRNDAEKDGAQWAEPRDPRVTRLGAFLRYTHLDELPQLWNILKGEVSFVGPRPERPEFEAELEKGIPYYRIRHLIKPGITGWAQINYRYGASTEESYQKLQYDLYYLKNRSLIMDAAIMLKTIKTFFATPR